MSRSKNSLNGWKRIKLEKLTIIKNSNDKNHKRRKVEFPEDSQQHKTKL